MQFKKTLIFSLTITTVLLSSFAHAQTTKWAPTVGRSGLEAGYNKFEDHSVVKTKRNVVRGVVGKGNVFDPFKNERVMEMVAAFQHAGQKITDPVTNVFLIVMPNASSNFGKVFQGLEDRDDKGRFYISPNSKVIAIADDQRIDLGKVSKASSLNIWGEYTGNAFITIPLEDFRKLAGAKKLEMALGRIEIKFPKRDFLERLRELVAELDTRSK